MRDENKHCGWGIQKRNMYCTPPSIVGIRFRGEIIFTLRSDSVFLFWTEKTGSSNRMIWPQKSIKARFNKESADYIQ